MTQDNKPLPLTENAEIRTLIAALHDNAQRLEDLTAGEVDAVADQQGRTFLLRRSQDHLRHQEASRQAAIVNALPAHIALLDAQGFLVSVNRAWRQYASAEALLGPDAGVGQNYLALCDGIRRDAPNEAEQAATGIRDVLAGSSRGFSLEYPVQSPQGPLWFLLTGAPLVEDHASGAVLTRMEVTSRKKADQKFRDLLEAAPDAMVIVNGQGDVVLFNAQAVKLFGWRPEELLGQKIDVLVPTHGRDRHPAHRLEYLAAPSARVMGRDTQLFALRKDGTEFPVDIRLSPLHTDEGLLVMSAIRDVTERRRADARIVFLNRVHTMLSSITTLIVRVHDRQELFQQACQIAVDSGGFRMSLIAMLDPVSRKIQLIASAGKNAELLDAIAGVLASNEEAEKTMIAYAIRDQRALVSNDSQTDSSLLLGKAYAEAGVRSVAVLPLLVGGDALGAFALYSTQLAFFQEEELQLITALASDIAYAMDHINKQERLDYLAYYDPLTGLANQTLFLERVAQYMRSATRDNVNLAIFLIDLERFKNINDSLGRASGDALLQQVAHWLTQHAGDVSLLARLDADHFAAVMPQVRQESDAVRPVLKALKALKIHPFRLNDAVFRIGARVGVAVFPADGGDANTLFMHAEAALKKAKTSREHFLLYTATMGDSTAGNLTLENQLRLALERNEFELYYQPKINLASGKITSAEALIRWNDPRSGLVLPGRFVPLLEETGLIYEVGRWALGQAVADGLRWRTLGLPTLRIAVNVSALQLRHRNFVDEVRQAIGVDPDAAGGLELEITESLIMEDVKHSITSLQAIRDMGLTVAIDDFGTGFSSLSYLSQFPVDTLKIDRSFVINMTNGPQGLALVSTIISLAHALALKVVAEGVETEEQSRLLLLLNCDEIQGYLFSKPVPREVFETRFLIPHQAATRPR
jgi:diguanylate cyclase (GGDEF)-like protein/PAS domain S-box-containing protein